MARGTNDSLGLSRPWDAWRPLVLLCIVLTLVLLGKLFEVGEQLGNLRHWIYSLGPWGPIVFMLLFTIAVVAAVPGSVLIMTSGALFGSVRGIVIASIASTIGASAAFLIARYFARDAAARWLSRYEKFRTLEMLTETKGAIVVALMRLILFVPFNLLNYAFGLTRVPFWTYVFWTWLCMLPVTVFYVIGADALIEIIAYGQIPHALLGALAAIGILLLILVRKVKRRLYLEQTKPAAEQTHSSIR